MASEKSDPLGQARFAALRQALADLGCLGGSEGIGATWKMPPTGETFDARHGRC